MPLWYNLAGEGGMRLMNVGKKVIREKCTEKITDNNQLCVL